MKRILLLVLFIQLAFAAQVWMYAPAVSNGEGVLAKIYAEVKPGTGKILVDVQPYVGEDTQKSARTAAQVASRLAGVPLDDKDVIISFEVNSVRVDGPSAGALMTVLIYSALKGLTPPSTVSITGTITDDGTVGPVGGVYEKAQAVADHGLKLFLIPADESVVNKTVNDELIEGSGIKVTLSKPVDLYNYGKAKWGIDVIGVKDINDVIYYIYQWDGSVKSVEERKTGVNIDQAHLDPRVMPFKSVIDSLVSKTHGYISDLNSKARTFDGLKEDVLSDLLDDLLVGATNADLASKLGHLYSAGNYAFVTSTQALKYKLLLDSYPNLLPNLQSEHANMMQELATVKSLVESTKNQIYDTNGGAWILSGVVRYYKAKNSLESSQNSTDPMALAQSIAESKLWLDAAKQMIQLGVNNLSGESYDINSDALSDYVKSELDILDQYIEKGEFDSSNPNYRMAELSYNDGFYLVSLSNIALALASHDLATGNVVLTDDLVNQTKLITSEPINDTGFSFLTLWANLYREHARFLASKSSSESTPEARGDAVSAYLIAKTYDYHLKFLNDFLSLKNTGSISTPEVDQNTIQNVINPSENSENSNANSNDKNASKEQTSTENQQDYTRYVQGILLLGLVVLIVIIISKQKPKEELTPSEMLDLLNTRYLRGEITRQEYLELKKYISEKSKEYGPLLKEQVAFAKREGVAAALSKVDSLYRKGKISKEASLRARKYFESLRV